MAKTLTLPERISLRLPPGKLAEIATVLSDDETRQDFIRSAIDRRLAELATEKATA